jgi:Uma2 family endonuclease
MIIFTPVLEKEITIKQTIPKFDGMRMTYDEFQNWNPETEEGIKYEWDNGVVEAEERMRIDEIHIYTNLVKTLQSNYKLNIVGYFISEVNIYFKNLNKIRRPDIIFLTEDEVQKTKLKIDFIPQFVIEVVSHSNSINEIENKIWDYFTSGVKIVWIILPNHKEVKIYKSIKDIKICLDNDVCDAGDVIPDFQIRVDEIFG